MRFRHSGFVIGYFVISRLLKKSESVISAAARVTRGVLCEDTTTCSGYLPKFAENCRYPPPLGSYILWCRMALERGVVGIEYPLGENGALSSHNPS